MKELHLNKQELFGFLIGIMGTTALYAILDNMTGILKYVILLSSSSCLLFVGRKNKWSLESVVLISLPSFIYVLLGLFSALINASPQVSTIKIVLYWITPLIFSFSLYVCFTKKMNKIVDIQFIGSILAYAFFDAPHLIKVFRWESVYAFTFGIFSIYYSHKKRWIPFIISLAFVIFAEKRIVLAAVAATLFVMMFVWLFKQNKKIAFGIWICVIGMIYVYLYMIYSGFLENFVWAANINTNGRAEIYSRMANEYSFSLGFMGAGIGTVEDLLEKWNMSSFSNLHNDLLKFYIELGFTGLLLFLFSNGITLYFIEKRFGKTQMSYFIGMIIYTVILWATDNVSIYMLYLIPFYSTFFAVLSQKYETEG